MKITRNTAENAAAFLRRYETPEAAAHQVRVQLQAIEPYTDRQLARVGEVLDYIASAKGERRERLTAQLLRGFLLTKDKA